MNNERLYLKYSDSWFFLSFFPALQFQIGELANTLTSKFEFLGINRQSISNFHVLLLQTEVIKPFLIFNSQEEKKKKNSVWMKCFLCEESVLFMFQS